MNTLRLAGWLLGTVAVGTLGFGYWTAVVAEQRYRALLAQTDPQAALQLHATEFKRRWPRSQAVTRATFSAPALADSDVELAFAHTIYHGLLPVDCPVRNARPSSVPITVHTTLAPQTTLSADLLALYPDGQSPLTVWLCSGLDGALDAELILAPLTLSHFGPLQRLDFAGLQAQLQQTATGMIEQAALTLAVTEIQTAAGALQLQGELQLQQFNPLQPQPSALQRAELRLASRGQWLETTLTTLFVEQLRQAASDPPPAPAQLARQAASKTTQLLDLLAASQFLERSEQGYRLHLLYADGELRLNGTARNPRWVALTLAGLIRPLLP